MGSENVRHMDIDAGEVVSLLFLYVTVRAYRTSGIKSTVKFL